MQDPSTTPGRRAGVEVARRPGFEPATVHVFDGVDSDARRIDREVAR